MLKFQVVLRYYVPASARIDVSPDSQAKADNRVTQHIASHGFDCHFLTDTEFAPGWEYPSELSIVESATERLLTDQP